MLHDIAKNDIAMTYSLVDKLQCRNKSKLMCLYV